MSALLLAGCGGSGSGEAGDSGAWLDSGLGELGEGQVGPDAPVDEARSYPGEPGATPIFETARANFFDQPFPSDTRRNADATIDLHDFPNPYDQSLLADYVKVGQAKLDGFSPNGAIYFRFDSALGQAPSLLPVETIGPDSPVLLVNVTPGAERFGELIPLEMWTWDREAPVEDYFLVPHLLIVRPLGGFPMEPAATYGCIVTRRLTDLAGKHVARNALVASALDGDPASPLYAELALVRDWVEQTAGIAAGDVAVATQFTVADPLAETAAAAAYIRDEATVAAAGPVVQKTTGSGSFDYFRGSYMAPNFMTGDPPYDAGGDILFEDSGRPKVQWMEKITFSLTVPKDAPTPAGGWPVVIYSHGTGGDQQSFMGSVGKTLSNLGLAVVSIDQPLHGERYSGPPVNVEFYSFNFANPLGARSLFRQSALDAVSLAKFVAELSFPASGKTVSFNPERIGFMGHSQGGLTGALTVAVDGAAKVALLSGAGGGLAYTILLRKELDSGTTFDIKAALEAVLNLEYEDELDIFHPVLTLVQMLVDVSDPLNYSQRYFYPRLRSAPLHVLITEGIEDPYTPAITTDNFAIAGGIPPLSPLAHNHAGFAIRGLDPLVTPIAFNLVLADGSKATAALAQFPGFGHFVYTENEDCVKLWSSLFSTALVENTSPTLDVK
jgi:predicted esterase